MRSVYIYTHVAEEKKKPPTILRTENIRSEPSAKAKNSYILIKTADFTCLNSLERRGSSAKTVRFAPVLDSEGSAQILQAFTVQLKSNINVKKSFAITTKDGTMVSYRVIYFLNYTLKKQF